MLASNLIEAEQETMKNSCSWSTNLIRFALLILAAIGIAGFLLQAQTEPMAYTVTSSLGDLQPQAVTTHYRLGRQVLVDQFIPAGEIDGGQATRRRTLYNLDSKLSLWWNPSDAAAPCVRSSFVADDWSDPFQSLPGKTDDENKYVGTERVLGFEAEVFESTDKEGLDFKSWVDPKTGLVLKAELISGHKGRTVYQVTKVDLAAPPSSIFEVPSSCSTFRLTPETEKLPGGRSREGQLGKFAWNGVVGPPTQDHCEMLLRVRSAGQSVETGTNGIEVAVDRSATDPLPGYSVRLTDQGHAVFSGGELHEIVAGADGLFRLEDVPDEFVIDVEFGKKGSASARIYRHCFAPRTILEYSVDMDDIKMGGTWEWVKPGMYRDYPQ
jgi:hypothetical protein